ncbi:MAG: transposase [Roseiflexus sp.]|nr:transposase [Roseiflexus sp.]
MPTSPLYLSTRARLAQHLPQALASQLDTLSLVLVGVVQSMSSQLAKIARAMPLDTTALAKEQRLRRWLDNERITQPSHYHPLVQHALHGLRGQRVQLLLDRVLLRNQHTILVVSVGFRRRSIPLVWCALPHRGSSNPREQQELRQTAVTRLPPDVRMSVHGDSEFRSPELFGWLRAQGYDAMLGIRGQIWVYASAEPHVDGRPLADHVTALPPQTATGRKRRHRASPVTYLAQVYLGQEQRYGPVNVLAWRERDDDGKIVLHAVMTNLPATAQTKAYGKRRMWIETVFRDWQSGGFHLDQSGLTDTKRVVQLLLVLALAYLWLVSVGRWVVKRGYRRIIDDGSARQWHFSFFQLGVGWKEHRASYTLPLPVLFHVSV